MDIISRMWIRYGCHIELVGRLWCHTEVVDKLWMSS